MRHGRAGQIRSAVGFILAENPSAAARVERALRLIGSFAEAGRPVPEYPEHQLHELLVRLYRMIYEIRGDEVRVLSFFHWSRELPAEPQFEPDPER